ncbi:MAG: VCBS repeat-containing protein [Desulfocapsa sp.]|nr:VCBS repeat-containing protein [Desulfocapsa sp.]
MRAQPDQIPQPTDTVQQDSIPSSENERGIHNRCCAAWGYRRLAMLFYSRMFSGKVGSFVRSIRPQIPAAGSAEKCRFSVLKAASLAAGTGLLFSQGAGVAQAQKADFRLQKPDIPLYGVYDNLNSDISFVDIDGDGDLDAFIAGTFKYGFDAPAYYENVGTQTDPLYREQLSTDNPFNFLNAIENLLTNGAPSFVDIDGDGDFDAFFGNNGTIYGGSSTITYFENIGTGTDPVFSQQDGEDNPLLDVTVRSSDVSFVDIDSDGDFDAFVRGDGELSTDPDIIQYFKNNGTADSAVFDEQTGGDNPFDGVEPGSYTGPNFVDIDGDGDFDAFLEDIFYRNTGTATVPSFTKVTGSDDPLDGINVFSSNTPTFADIDGDGDFDAFIGNKLGAIIAVKNDGSAETPNLQIWTDSAVPLSGSNVSATSHPSFVDIDNDGDFDVFIGEKVGSVNFSENTGTQTVPVFIGRVGAGNPFDGIIVAPLSSPSFVDIDGDGDFDAFIGDVYGLLRFYKNSGTSAVPIFTEQTGAANPFDLVDVGEMSSPSFVDIDGDGDFDAIIGERDGSINFFKNNGTSAIPVFTEQTGAANPFDGADVGYSSIPSFTDIDGDGDFDAFIGEKTGAINYFENTGTDTVPSFTQHTGSSNPFYGVDVGYMSSPSFVDINNNGRADAFIGSMDGKIQYYNNYYFPWNLFYPAILKKK